MLGLRKLTAVKSGRATPRSVPTARVESKDFQTLSGLRGLAAIIVVFRHIEINKYLCGYAGFAESGVFMVATFFALSAFLLSFRALRDDVPGWGHPRAHYGLAHLINSKGSWTPQQAVPFGSRVRHIGLELLRPTQYWAKYLTRRFFRVWPLYAFIVICAHQWPSEISSRLYGAFSGDIWDSFLLRDRLIGREMAQFWSLRPEFGYYFLIPFYIITWKAAEKFDGVHLDTSLNPIPETEKPSIFEQGYTSKGVRWRSLHFAVSLIICLTEARFNSLWDSAHQEQHVGPYLPIFWAGTAGAMALHVLLQKGAVVNPQNFIKSASRFLSRRGLGDTLALAIAGAVVACDEWYYTIITGHAPEDHFWSWGPREHPDGYINGPKYLVWAGGIVTAFILSILIFSPRGAASSMLSTSVLLRAGDISFSIYSVHPVVASWLDGQVLPSSLNSVDRLVVVLVGIWIVAEITYRCVEMPFMRLGGLVCRQIDELAAYVEFFCEDEYQQVPSSVVEMDLSESGLSRPQ